MTNDGQGQTRGWSGRLIAQDEATLMHNPAHVVKASRVLRIGYFNWQVQLMESGGVWVYMGRTFTRRGAVRHMRRLESAIKR